MRAEEQRPHKTSSCCDTHLCIMYCRAHAFTFFILQFIILFMTIDRKFIYLFCLNKYHVKNPPFLTPQCMSAGKHSIKNIIEEQFVYKLEMCKPGLLTTLNKKVPEIWIKCLVPDTFWFPIFHSAMTVRLQCANSGIKCVHLRSPLSSVRAYWHKAITVLSRTFVHKAM